MLQFLCNRLLQKGILRDGMVDLFLVVFYLLLELLHLSNQRIMLNFHFLILCGVNVDFILKLLLEIEALLKLLLEMFDHFVLDCDLFLKLPLLLLQLKFGIDQVTFVVLFLGFKLLLNIGQLVLKLGDLLLGKDRLLLEVSVEY